MHHVRADLAVIGAGIAGLWSAALLRARGYSVVIVEWDAAGAGQTGASQGIVHGGMKYALGGRRTRASEAAARMPARWRAALAGEGPGAGAAAAPSLQGLGVASDAVHLYCTHGLSNRLVTFFASRSLQGRVDRVAADALPAWLTGGPGAAPDAPPHADPHTDSAPLAYRGSDFVLDPRALCERLLHAVADAGIHGRVQSMAADEHAVTIDVAAGTTGVRIVAGRLLLAAGAGNAALTAMLGRTAPAMQLRPLHQVWARAPRLPHVYAHCLSGLDAAALLEREPRLTITTQVDDAPVDSVSVDSAKGDAGGDVVWSLGGALATQGVAHEPAAQRAHARAELAACLPRVRLPDGLRIATARIDRAEPRMPRGRRPDGASLHYAARVFTVWPTKLALAPALGDALLAALTEQGFAPRTDADLAAAAAAPRIPLAPPFWRRLAWH